MGIRDRLGETVSNVISGSKNNPVENFLNGDDALSFTFQSETITLTRETAMQIPALANGINYICQTVASLPIYLYKKNDDGTIEKLENDNRSRLLNGQVNAYMTGFDFKANMINDFIFYGNSYASIERTGRYEIKELYHIPHKNVSLMETGGGDRRTSKYSYRFWSSNNVDPSDVMNFCRKPLSHPLVGIGILEENKILLASLLGLLNYQNNAVANGFNAKIAVEAPNRLTKEKRSGLIDYLKKFSAGSINSGSGIVLDEDMKIKTLNTSMLDVQFIEQQNQGVKDIARILGLPVSVLGLANSGMTYSNQSENMLLVLQHLSSLLENFEECCNMYLLKEREKGKYVFKFDLSEFFRTSPQDEMNLYKTGIDAGVFDVNEVRLKLNMSPKEDKDSSVEEIASPQLQIDSPIIEAIQVEDEQVGIE